METYGLTEGNNDDADIFSLVATTFWNMRNINVSEFSLSNASVKLAFLGIQTRETWSIGPLCVFIALWFVILSVACPTLSRLRRPIDSDSELESTPADDHDVAENSDRKTRFSTCAFVVVILLALVFIPLMFLFLTLPMSFLFLMFSFTRKYITDHTDDDITKSAMLIDAVMGGLVVPSMVIAIAGLFHIFERQKTQMKQYRWYTLNIIGEVMRIPTLSFVPAAVILVIMFVLSPNPANNLLFYPLVLVAYLWNNLKDILARKSGKPSQELYSGVVRVTLYAFIILYSTSFGQLYLNGESEELMDSYHWVLRRCFPWIVYDRGLSSNAWIVNSFVWCFCFDSDQEKKRSRALPNDTIEGVQNSLLGIPEPVETTDRSVESFSRPVISYSYCRDLFGGTKPISPITGLYSRAAFIFWASGNIVLYFTLMYYEIYLTSISYAFVSSLVSHVFMVVGIFSLALTRKEFFSVWRYEVHAILVNPDRNSRFKWGQNLAAKSSATLSNDKELKDTLIAV